MPARLKYLTGLFLLQMLALPSTGMPSAEYPNQLLSIPWPTDQWPTGTTLPDDKRLELQRRLESAFAPDNRRTLQGARGVVVIHRGQLVAEGYRQEYTETSLFPSWSVAKSFTSALTGIAVREGLFAIDDPVPVKAWQGENDGRSEITISHLLRMESGLDYTEGEGGDNDNNEMLFGSGRMDMAGYAANKPLLHQPGTHWNYATGTTNILSSIIRDSVGGDEQHYRDFIHRELVDRLGMRSAVMEFDPTGNFLGGIYLYATTRDYAKFGLLYLRDGVWEGKRILPEGWVNFTRTPTLASDGKYGAQFWLDTRGTRETLTKRGRSYPQDMFLARGYGGQFIFIIPSKDLVIAYNGFADYNTTNNDEDSDVDIYITDLIEMFPNNQEEETGNE